MIIRYSSAVGEEPREPRFRPAIKQSRKPHHPSHSALEQKRKSSRKIAGPQPSSLQLCRQASDKKRGIQFAASLVFLDTWSAAAGRMYRVVQEEGLEARQLTREAAAGALHGVTRWLDARIDDSPQNRLKSTGRRAPTYTGAKPAGPPGPECLRRGTQP